MFWGVLPLAPAVRMVRKQNKLAAAPPADPEERETPNTLVEYRILE